MIIAVCVDDDRGMLFNKRRQSKDRKLRERLLELSKGSNLLMNNYSAKQFGAEGADRVTADDDFLGNAGAGDYCFVENSDVIPYEEHIEKLIVYKWNRKYPADTYFTIPFAEHGWKLVQSTDFSGSSHEKITEEVYIR